MVDCGCTLQMDPPVQIGIIDNRFANLNYASGTCMILSKTAD